MFEASMGTVPSDYLSVAIHEVSALLTLRPHRLCLRRILHATAVCVHFVHLIISLPHVYIVMCTSEGMLALDWRRLQAASGYRGSLKISLDRMAFAFPSLQAAFTIVTSNTCLALALEELGTYRAISF